MGLAAATAYMKHACTGPPIGRIITPANENQFVYAKSLSKTITIPIYIYAYPTSRSRNNSFLCQRNLVDKSDAMTSYLCD